MRKDGIFLVFILLLVFGNSIVYADSCDNQDIARLRTLASYVDVTYDYIESEDLYSVTINGITNELFAIDKDRMIEYQYYNEIDGNISFKVEAGNLSLDVYSNNCDTRPLKSISLNLPKFNKYSKEYNCEKFASYNLDFCDPWYQGELNDGIFIDKMESYLYEEYLRENSTFDFISFIKENILYVVIGGLVLLGIIILLIIKRRRRSVLE